MRTIGRNRSSSRTRVLLAALAGTVALLAFGAGAAVASTSSTSESTSTCWNQVINDWVQHEPNVLGTYPIACYTQAISHLTSFSDIQGYSNAPDDIRRALLAVLHNGGSGGSSSSNGSSPSGPSGTDTGGGTAATHKSVITKLFDAVGPGDAQSIPLPLLVLAGLAVLLLLTAAGTWLAKRIQARRMTPAPAPARRQ